MYAFLFFIGFVGGLLVGMAIMSLLQIAGEADQSVEEIWHGKPKG